MKGTILLNDVTSPVTNIYRTNDYIVYQTVHVCYGENGNVLFSEDVFRRRTPERDKQYEKEFGAESVFNKRKRMKVSASTRTYC